MHVSTVAGQTLARFGHETGSDAEFAADVLHCELEESSAIGHLSDLSIFKCCLVHTRARLRMPALDVAAEFGACVEYTVVPVLVVNRSCERVAKHALFKRWKAVHRVVAQELGGSRGVALVGRLIR